jgi:molybdopterin/thiamine biosynthesis adenylyltransferase
VYPTELQFGQQSDAWLFVLTVGKRKDFYSNAQGHGPKALVVRTLRAGPNDLGSRSPNLTDLAEKVVAVIGIGAVGAPVAIELARSGVGELALVDHDIVEPGNSIRWPLGVSAWGQSKAQALADFIAAEYPNTKVRAFNYPLGAIQGENYVGDSPALERVLKNADLAVDGTAAFGATLLIQDAARSLSLPLIALYASPSVGGGVVALYSPEGACPICLEYAWDDERNGLCPPRGMFDQTELVQPPGCAERTFLGSFFDLEELSLQAVRLIVGLLNGKASAGGSRVFTLEFHESDGVQTPSWRVDALAHNQNCGCNK